MLSNTKIIVFYHPTPSLGSSEHVQFLNQPSTPVRETTFSIPQIPYDTDFDYSEWLAAWEQQSPAKPR